MEAQVERVVGRNADPNGARRKRMTEAVPIQKGGMQRTHIAVSSMPRLHEPPVQAKEGVPKPGQGVGSCIDFPPRNGLRHTRPR